VYEAAKVTATQANPNNICPPDKSAVETVANPAITGKRIIFNVLFVDIFLLFNYIF
jgi:hypothetical protein